jgi:hypothetical protein
MMGSADPPANPWLSMFPGYQMCKSLPSFVTMPVCTSDHFCSSPDFLRPICRGKFRACVRVDGDFPRSAFISPHSIRQNRHASAHDIVIEIYRKGHVIQPPATKAPRPHWRRLEKFFSILKTSEFPNPVFYANLCYAITRAHRRPNSISRPVCNPSLPELSGD